MLGKNLSQIYMVKVAFQTVFAISGHHKSLTTAIPINSPQPIHSRMSKQQKITHRPCDQVWGIGPPKVIVARTMTLFLTAESVIINRNQGECFMHARTEQNTTHIIHTQKNSLYPNSKRRERARERDPIGVIGTKTLEIHTHTYENTAHTTLIIFMGGSAG